MMITTEKREAEAGRKTERDMLGSGCGYGVPETLGVREQLPASKRVSMEQGTCFTLAPVSSSLCSVVCEELSSIASHPQSLPVSK